MYFCNSGIQLTYESRTRSWILLHARRHRRHWLHPSHLKQHRWISKRQLQLKISKLVQPLLVRRSMHFNREVIYRKQRFQVTMSKRILLLVLQALFTRTRHNSHCRIIYRTTRKQFRSDKLTQLLGFSQILPIKPLKISNIGAKYPHLYQLLEINNLCGTVIQIIA